MIAVEEALKIEVGEVKTETTEIDNESFGVGQSTWELPIKDDSCDYTDEIVSNRVKNECNYAEDWIKCDVKNGELVEMQSEQLKLEKDLDIGKLEVTEITEEVILKNENDCDTLIDTNPEIVCNRISSEYAEVEDGTTFTSTPVIGKIEESVVTYKQSEIHECIHCNATFKRKQCLDDHIIKKHPDFITSISSKIHQCTHCTYKTIMKCDLDRHMLKHFETSGNYKLSTCIHCNATFKRKTTLDDHTIRKHPDFMASISSKIHECAHCSYKTTMKTGLVRHISKHPEASYKLTTCIQCNETFTSKQKMDDHTIKMHPNCIASVSCKIHECTHCTYKTVRKGELAQHVMWAHPDTSGSKLSTCIHCNGTFKSQLSLDDHIIRKHPDFIELVSSKIHECKKCTYKTTIKIALANHVLEHYGAVRTFKLRTCKHCNATFKRKQNLDGHILKKHPDYIPSICRTIHECKLCTYKTIWKSTLAQHMLKHPETSGNYKHKLSTCVHCNATFKRKQNLDGHLIKKHPEFIASVSTKIHACTQCAYITPKKNYLAKHMLKHSDI